MVQGASFGQALKAGIISGISAAAAFNAIGEYFYGLEGANQASALEYNLQFLDSTSAYVQAGKVGLTSVQSLGKIGAHALTGGVMSMMGGGKFGNGFASAGFTQSLSGSIGGIGGTSTTFGPTVSRIVAASALGGTASKLTGAKFANGAITGAFSRTLNDELHLGLSYRIPDLLRKALSLEGQGVSFGVAVSRPFLTDGEWDIGFYGTVVGAGDDIGTGRITVDLGWGRGDIRNNLQGQGSEVGIHYQPVGVNWDFDSAGAINGATLHLGFGYSVSGGGTITKTATLRDLTDRLLNPQ